MKNVILGLIFLNAILAMAQTDEKLPYQEIPGSRAIVVFKQKLLLI